MPRSPRTQYIHRQGLNALWLLFTSCSPRLGLQKTLTYAWCKMVTFYDFGLGRGVLSAWPSHRYGAVLGNCEGWAQVGGPRFVGFESWGPQISIPLDSTLHRNCVIAGLKAGRPPYEC